MHNIHAPDDTEWEVFVEWEGRKPLHRAFRRLRQYREARAQKRTENRSLDLLDGCGPDGGEAFFWIVAIVLAVFVIVVLGPWILLALFGIVELGLILIAVVIGLVGRTLTRRPWRVAAVSHHGHVWAWRQTGFWKARRLAGTIARGLESGASPGSLAEAQLESPEPIRIGTDPDTGPLTHPAIRIASIVILVAAVVGIVVTIALRV